MQKTHGTLISAFVLLIISSCSFVSNKNTNSTESFSVAIGTVSPKSFSLIPDWTMTNVRSCYAEGLRINPNQEGKVIFSVIPPIETGPVEASIIESEGLSSNLIDCIHAAFATIHHYKGKGRMQEAITDTLFFSRVVENVCPPPSIETIKKVVSDYYDEYNVVKLSNLKIRNLRHGISEYEDNLLLRFVTVDVELVFYRNGYEGHCYHGYEYKVFSTEPISPEGVGHECKSTKRRKGDRVKDIYTIIFELESGVWWEDFEEIAYCGNRRMEIDERY